MHTPYTNAKNRITAAIMKNIMIICITELIVRGAYVWYYVITHSFAWPEPSVWGGVNAAIFWVVVLLYIMSRFQVEKEKDIMDHLVE